MAFELKDGQGSFFKNADKQPDDNRPAYRGEFKLDGTLYKIAGWIKEGPRGKWMSLSVEPKDDAPKHAKPEAKAERSLDSW